MDGPLTDLKISGKSESTVTSNSNSNSKSGSLLDSKAHPIPTVFNKFILYENRAKFFIVASNVSESRHRILKIDRTIQEALSIVEDDTEYTGRYMNSTLRALDEANKPFGGLGKGRVFFGLVGVCLFPHRFLTRCSEVYESHRVHTVHRWMVYDHHREKVGGRAPWWTLLVPL